MGPTSAVRRVLREVWAVGAKKKAAKKAVAANAPAGKSEKPEPKPVKNGQVYIKTAVLKQLGEITDGMISKAVKGGTAPLKLLWELGKLHEDPTNKRTKEEPSLAKFLMQDLRKKAAVKRMAASAAEHEAETGK